MAWHLRRNPFCVITHNDCGRASASSPCRSAKPPAALRAGRNSGRVWFAGTSAASRAGRDSGRSLRTPPPQPSASAQAGGQASVQFRNSSHCSTRTSDRNERRAHNQRIWGTLRTSRPHGSLSQLTIVCSVRTSTVQTACPCRPGPAAALRVPRPRASRLSAPRRCNPRRAAAAPCGRRCSPPRPAAAPCGHRCPQPSPLPRHAAPAARSQARCRAMCGPRCPPPRPAAAPCGGRPPSAAALCRAFPRRNLRPRHLAQLRQAGGGCFTLLPSRGRA